MVSVCLLEHVALIWLNTEKERERVRERERERERERDFTCTPVLINK